MRWLTRLGQYLICWPRQSNCQLPLTEFPNLREFWIEGLRVWHLPSTSHRLVLACHGNKRHLGNLLPLIRLFHDLNWDVVIFDYHGFGQSSSHPAMYSAAGMTDNIRTILQWVQQHLPDKRLFMVTLWVELLWFEP
jgi:predicted alpha/beta-fold hydrolase